MKRPRPGAFWHSFTASLAAHALVLTMVLTNPKTANTRGSPEDALKHATPLFIPKPVAAVSSPPRQSDPNPLSRSLRDPLPPWTETASKLPEMRVDMNTVELTFDDDVTNQLPEVVRMHAGVLALLDKEELGIARYLIEPPGWEIRETLLDVSRKVRLAMYQPQKWALLRSLALQHSIALDRYQVCALFESSYRRCLQEAIRSRAAELSEGRGRRVKSARLAFNKANPCGVTVLEVMFVPEPVP